eukprot:1155954-Pelagomonas_calceolata.AAC.5
MQPGCCIEQPELAHSSQAALGSLNDTANSDLGERAGGRHSSEMVSKTKPDLCCVCPWTGMLGPLFLVKHIGVCILALQTCREQRAPGQTPSE